MTGDLRGSVAVGQVAELRVGVPVGLCCDEDARISRVRVRFGGDVPLDACIVEVLHEVEVIGKLPTECDHRVNPGEDIGSSGRSLRLPLHP